MKHQKSQLSSEVHGRNEREQALHTARPDGFEPLHLLSICQRQGWRQRFSFFQGRGLWEEEEGEGGCEERRDGKDDETSDVEDDGASLPCTI